MTRYYPNKPYKHDVRKNYSTTESLLISLMVSMVCALVSLVILMGFNVPASETGKVFAGLFSGAGVGFVVSFIKMRFGHIPKRIKVNRAFKKDMKKYNKCVAEIDLRGERADSEAFIKLLKTGTVTRRSYEP